jgi:hypothetical protein
MRDSTSMKTIAIVTMLFLPATFYAALFAVPSLEWTESPVITDKFWIYWAFTLPTTIVVFVVWLGLLNWNALLETLFTKQKRKHAKV